VPNQTVEDIPGFAGEKNLSFTERAVSTLIGFGLMGRSGATAPQQSLEPAGAPRRRRSGDSRCDRPLPG
jgi:hypothetical protein